ncbi:glycosyltransferase family 4 protein [Aquiflexum sp. LQ15W]|uniref:glycosyltransferase family 4 protein n=1 Tax=Cognataquiflexum nitidum TaxID=2922272 RepID=UPI001F137F14|nr:glycosyltransferase family 4 protein [Cognataquiflexum nitidum]MCH6201336.1 glycosyltransferase family 4 protein [Cognataquiflexum nitidum]
MKKLAIVSTHPIQYNAPWFRLLSERTNIQVKVFYTWSQRQTQFFDVSFGKEIKWDIPLLEGYDYEFVDNISKKPSSSHFQGIDCPMLISTIESFFPDTILVFGWNLKSHLKVLRHFKGKVKLWFRGDSTLLDESKGFKTLLRRILLTWVYSHVDKALYVGAANKAYFLKHGIKEVDLLSAPHAIDNYRFADDETKQYAEKAKNWRAGLGYLSEDIVVLFAGKFHSVKRPEFLIKAIIEANIKRANPLQLLFVGNGPMKDQLKDLARPYNFIKFIPFQNQSQMPLVYRLGEIYCLPSKSETWGLAVNEAMACGIPVIVTDKVGCARDLVKENENGFVIKHNQQPEFEKLLTGLSLPVLKQMGEAAQKNIQKWSFDAIVKEIERGLD